MGECNFRENPNEAVSCTPLYTDLVQGVALKAMENYSATAIAESPRTSVTFKLKGSPTTLTSEKGIVTVAVKAVKPGAAVASDVMSNLTEFDLKPLFVMNSFALASAVASSAPVIADNLTASLAAPVVA